MVMSTGMDTLRLAMTIVTAFDNDVGDADADVGHYNTVGNHVANYRSSGSRQLRDPFIIACLRGWPAPGCLIAAYHACMM